MDKTKRIGVFGGTFDPVHIGHLMLAETAREQVDLSLVLFMPAFIQPFKQDIEMTPDEDRIRMLSYAIKNNSKFDLTTIECQREGISYTIDSLRALREEYKGCSISFLIGTDMFLNIEKWKDADALLKEFDLIVGVRPGYLYDEAESLAAKLKDLYGTRIDLIDNPPVDLSSTEIRNRIKNKESIRYRVPESVWLYLLVQEKLGKKRFDHTKRVMDLASEMAVTYGEDRYKAETAALLHDYCKDSAGGIENDLNHASMAAEVAKEEFGVTDEDILNAIRYHTTARAGMSKLEKILFLADTVEPGRTYDSIERLRQTSLDDLDSGVYLVLTELKIYLEKNGLTITEDTEAAIADCRGAVSASEKKRS